MPATCTLAIIGASDETVAHIRLLLRIAGTRLEQQWELRDGDDADLIIIQSQGDLATSAVQTRCEATGVPYAILADIDELVVHGMALRRPLKLEQLVAILNAAGRRQDQTGIMPGLGADFYSAALDTAGTDAAAPVQAAADRTDFGAATDGTDSFDLLVHGDPTIEPVPDAPLVTAETTLEKRLGGDSARSALQRDAGTRVAASLVGVVAPEVLPIDLGPAPSNKPLEFTVNGANAGVPVLPALLRPGQLRSPHRVHAEGLPDIVLDPKTRCYYSRSPLHELAPYATASAARVRYEGIVGRDFQKTMGNSIPRKFDELDWLIALVNSKGHLDPKLDPGGSYAIDHPFAAAPELRHHGRITEAMSTPVRLHEAAQASGARMEDVFDIVNAYASIERIRCIPRQSLRQSETKAEKRGLWSLFSRK